MVYPRATAFSIVLTSEKINLVKNAARLATYADLGLVGVSKNGKTGECLTKYVQLTQ
jgi:hypothetical protein